MMLQDYSDLIDPSYSKWFAKRFYFLTFEEVSRAASEARREGRGSGQKLFTMKIKQMYQAKQKTTQAEHTS